MHGILFPCFPCMCVEFLKESMLCNQCFMLATLPSYNMRGELKNIAVNVVFVVVIGVSDLLHLILSKVASLWLSSLTRWPWPSEFIFNA